MKYLFLIFSLFTLSVSAQTVLPNPSTVTAATINAVLTGHITSSTAANDYTGLLTGWTSYPGAFDIRFTNHNTGSATFNLNSIGAKTLKKYSSGSLVDLVSGDISDGEVIRFQYDGTYLIKMGGGSVDVPGSDTQIIRNVSGALGASSALYYDATNNIFNASSNLTKVGSGSRSNNFYLGIDHTDSVASSTSNGWNFLQGEHETVSNNGSNGSVINNSFFYGGYRNAIRVKSGSASTIYNSGIIGGQDNYISASNSLLGSSVIIGGIKNRITATGVTRKGIAIIGGEKNIVTGNHSVAIGGYSQSVTDSATVAVPNLNITTSPVIADTTVFVLGRRSSDGKIIKIHASSLGGGGGSTTLGTITADPFNYPASGNTLDVFGGRTRGNLQSVFNAYTLPVITGLNNRLVIDGNSQGDGAALLDTTKRYGTVAAALLGGASAGYTYKNFAVGGQTTVNMNTDAVSQIDGSYVAGKSKNYLAAFEVENDAAINTGSSTSTLYSNISSYWSGRKAAGYYVIAMTSPLRNSYSSTVQDLTVNQRIEIVNASIRSGTSDYNTLIDIPAIPRLSNVRSRVGFLNDNLHFNYSGHADLADRVVSKIRADLSQQDYTPPNFASWNGNTPDRSMILGSLNSQPLGFITNGKVRGEFESFGTFNVNAHVVATNDIPFGIKNQAIGMFINPGLKAGANGDIMSALTIQTEYFDPVSFTGTTSDNFTINRQLTANTHTNLMRIGASGELSFTPKLSGAATSAISINPTITGPSSGNYIENSITDAYSFNSNNQAHTTVDIAPNLTRGSFTNVNEVTVNINSGSTATTADVALKVNAVEGTGIDMSNHAGTQNALNIISSSSGAGVVSVMTAAAAMPILAAKTLGTAPVGDFITQSTSNASGLLDMFGYERRSVSQVAGTGLSNYVILKSDQSLSVRSNQEDYYWLSNASGAENAAIKWSNVIVGTLTEGMRLEGKNLTVAGGLSLSYAGKTGTYAITASDYLINCTANSFTVTLPTAVGIAGKMYIIKNTGTATVITIATTSSQTIDGSVPGTITTLTPTRVMSDGANWITF